MFYLPWTLQVRTRRTCHSILFPVTLHKDCCSILHIYKSIVILLCWFSPRAEFFNCSSAFFPSFLDFPRGQVTNWDCHSLTLMMSLLRSRYGYKISLIQAWGNSPKQWAVLCPQAFRILSSIARVSLRTIQGFYTDIPTCTHPYSQTHTCL